MKRLFYIIIAVLMAAPAMQAQDYTPVPVTISKDKVKVDGKLYYSHIVLERQTLYSICRAYNVTMEDIWQANPSVKTDGLKKNAILLIPVKESPTPSVQPAQQEKKAEKKGKKQTVHTVKWYEGLSDIATRYGVSEEAIMQANNLTSRTLTKRQKLIIPDSSETVFTPVEIVESEVQETMAASIPATDSTLTEEVGEEAADILKSDKVSAVLMLPFNSAGEKPRSGSIDFYCGMLMAVKELGDRGINIDLSVYDIDGTEELPVTAHRLKESDVVIGPISAGDLSRLIEKFPDQACVVSPLDHKAEYLSRGNTHFIQAPTSSLTQYEDLAHWIKEERQSSEERVIVIHEKGSRNIEEAGMMNAILDKDGIPYHSFSYSILEGRDIQDSLMVTMNVEATNRVLVMSESEAFVNDVVRNLNLLIHNGYNVVLYGPSKIRNFETIEVDNFHNTRLHTSTNYYVDYSDRAVKDFVMKYRALYKAEPTPFAFQGYDVGTYFLNICAQYGRSWKSYLQTNDRHLLQANFKFRRAGSEEDGFVNTGVRRIVYGPDYSITLQEEL